ncbi:MAG: isocitrate lyase/phosphoenolpyruvate mutase family protein [Pseudomonadota bacterium]
MVSQAEKGRIFRELHHQPGAFLIPNPWDAGTARLLEMLGFTALASTSAGHAFSQGLPDNGVSLEPTLRHLADLSAATELPVSADLGNGFGIDPESIAETIRLAAAAGVVGASIEDTTGEMESPIHDLGLAIERIRSAVDVARGLSFPFTLTARADNYVVGRPDLKDTIRRLQAFQDAGADVLYAPGLKTLEEIRIVVASVDRPVNVLMGFADVAFGVAELSGLGVKRVSVGGSLARAALGAFLRASREMRECGTFSYGRDAVSSKEIDAMLQQGLSGGNEGK